MVFFSCRQNKVMLADPAIGGDRKWGGGKCGEL